MVPLHPLLLAGIAIALFSTTAGATRIAAQDAGGLAVGGGRVLLGGLLAAALLVAARAPLPGRGQWPGLVLTALGCGAGFPILLALALEEGRAGAVVGALAIIPLLTAGIGRCWDGEPVGGRAWAMTGLGAVLVMGDALVATGGRPVAADAWALAAAVVAAGGYAAGGRAARVLPGWQVVCWAATLALPAGIVCLLAAPAPPAAPSAAAWAALVWVSVVSHVLGIIPWYAAMARWGVARIGSLQAVQPGLSGIMAWLLAGEPPRPGTLAVIAVLAAGWWWAWRPSAGSAPAQPGLRVPVPAGAGSAGAGAGSTGTGGSGAVAGAGAGAGFAG